MHWIGICAILLNWFASDKSWLLNNKYCFLVTVVIVRTSFINFLKQNHSDLFTRFIRKEEDRSEHPSRRWKTLNSHKLFCGWPWPLTFLCENFPTDSHASHLIMFTDCVTLLRLFGVNALLKLRNFHSIWSRSYTGSHPFCPVTPWNDAVSTYSSGALS